MTGIREVEWEECLLEPRRDPALARDLRRQLGEVPPAPFYFAALPWAPRRVADLLCCLQMPVYVERDLADTAGLVVAQDNSCRYCYAAHRAFMRIMGVSEARIRQLEQDALPTGLDVRYQRGLEFVRRVSRSSPLPGVEDTAALRRVGFAPLAVKELAAIAGVNVFLNRLSTLPALPFERMEAMPDRWFMRLARPVIAWRIRAGLRGSRKDAADEATATTSDGPFAGLAAALEGLPLARALSRLMNDLRASRVMESRAKAMVFAVVARGIGCSVSEGEAVAWLASEGLDDSDVAETLDHLASPRLTPREVAIASLARESIWYHQPVRVQRRARELRDALSEEEFLELILSIATANLVCRLAVVADGSSREPAAG